MPESFRLKPMKTESKWTKLKSLILQERNGLSICQETGGAIHMKIIIYWNGSEYLQGAIKSNQ